MTDEQKRHLISLRDTLTKALGNINKILADTEAEGKVATVSLPDSFSEEKEKFIAP